MSVLLKRCGLTRPHGDHQWTEVGPDDRDTPRLCLGVAGERPAIRKTELSTGEQWVGSDGHVMTLCVCCELSNSIASVQASVVFIGVSLCLRHLETVRTRVGNGYMIDSILISIAQGKL